MWHAWEARDVLTGVWLDNQGLDVAAFIDFIWLRPGTSGSFVKTVMNFQIPQMWGSF
jgi:hypothetical protein